MSRTEKMLDISQKLPGYYGYKPYFDDQGEVKVSEIIFQLEDKEKNCDYNLKIEVENEKCKRGLIEIRYDDYSIAQVEENDLEFLEILSHKNKVIRVLNNA